MENNKTIKAPEIKEGEDVSPYQQCLIDNDGKCGVCSDPGGVFTPCPAQ